MGNCLKSEKQCSPQDRISSLPNDVLLDILSFLKLKEVGKTSLLSRRWQNVWMHTPVLNFFAPTSDTQDYVKWVSNVLSRHRGHSLKEFKIACHLNFRYQEDIDNWLKFALSKKVQCLELNLLFLGFQPTNRGDTDNYAFPNRFLEFDLKSLKSLSFKQIDITGEAINCFLLSCPFLERLEVVISNALASLVISGPNFVLKYLQIKWCRHFEVLRISDFNLVSLDVPTIGDLTLTGLPMLAELSISRMNPFSTISTLSQVAACHPQLEALTLTSLKLKCIWYNPERSNRTMIEVERGSSSLKSENLKVFKLLGYYGRVSDVELIMHVVENAICLEKIIIDPRHPIEVECPGYSESAREQKARRFAKKQLKALRNSRSIPPHVDVLIC